MVRGKVVALALLAALLVAGVAQWAEASGDLFEVAQVASDAEGSTRTWAYRTFLVLCLVAGFAAISTVHIGVFMAAMGLLFLGAFVAKGPDAISDAVGLAEGATLAAVAPAPVRPAVIDVRSPRPVGAWTPQE